MVLKIFFLILLQIIQLGTLDSKDVLKANNFVKVSGKITFRVQNEMPLKQPKHVKNNHITLQTQTPIKILVYPLISRNEAIEQTINNPIFNTMKQAIDSCYSDSLGNYMIKLSPNSYSFVFKKDNNLLIAETSYHPENKLFTIAELIIKPNQKSVVKNWELSVN
ncbi:MAG: hypothetical protein QM539_06310 [Alphaproteobacteria bacterium]|nr:hypothetical protein [Alphaproteobacteria bacterium]